MVVVPWLAAVIRPVLETEATCVLEEKYVMLNEVFEGLTTTSSWKVEPMPLSARVIDSAFNVSS